MQHHHDVTSSHQHNNWDLFVSTCLFWLSYPPDKRMQWIMAYSHSVEPWLGQETGTNRIVWNCVETLTLHLNQNRGRDLLSLKILVLLPIPVSVLVLSCVNATLQASKYTFLIHRHALTDCPVVLVLIWFADVAFVIRGRVVLQVTPAVNQTTRHFRLQGQREQFSSLQLFLSVLNNSLRQQV